jgi:hypothetical protein
LFIAITPVVFNVECEITDIVKVDAFDGVFDYIGVVGRFSRWDGIDCFCRSEIRSKCEINVLAIVETTVLVYQREMYILIVRGAVESGGARMRMDLSLTWPVNGM